MKQVISISLGSSKRDHRVETEILGESFIIERRGTDGDKKKAIEMIRELDGKVDAFGMGGTDLYIRAGKRVYTLRDSIPIARAAKATPIVDGSGLKNTLERRAVRYLTEELKMPLGEMTALVPSAVDRFGMAESLVEVGCQAVFGDLIFILGLPFPIRTLKALERVTSIVAPIACQLPISMLYPTGDKQEKSSSKYEKYYRQADIIAGDFHLVFKYMPEDMTGKIVLTNTVTEDNVKELRRRGVKQLITTTPELNGRSFGTNVMEGVLIALAGQRPEDMSVDDYDQLLDRIDFRPRVAELN